MIVVTTPTGKIGSQVIPHLLAAKESVRVVVRDASRLAPEIRENLDVVTGSLDETVTMEKALKGAESVFLVVPPSFSDNNDAEYYLRFTRPALNAIKSQGVKRGRRCLRAGARNGTCQKGWADYSLFGQG